MGLLILCGCFLVLRPLAEAFIHEPEAALRRHLGALVFATAGVLTFCAAAVLDRRSGVDVFSKVAWTSQLMESQHIMLFQPLRLVGVVYFVASFLF